MKEGLHRLGTFGLHAQGKIGAKERQGTVRIDLPDDKWTAVYYYNRPDKAIPYRGEQYVHHTLPAYLVKKGSGPDQGWYVGTKEEIRAAMLED